MGAFTYPRSEPGSAGHLDLIERLNSNAQTLRSKLMNVAEAELARSGEGSWSIKDIVGHLCDHSHVLRRRLWKMINLEEPVLDTYDHLDRSGKRSANSASIKSLLEEFEAQRAETVEMLVDLVHWNWARTGRHPDYGRTSIRQQVDRWLAHEDEHLAQIDSLMGKGQS